ncbi:transposase [Aerococcus sp. HMSC062A02]|uniref:transposase n=1 Tax=Aerococcus sp. HMSC062A02 TaxID=1715105 RepID=UPI0008A3065D|nr:transposase [Aerococcus sp. HMSC062A02]OFN02618.1 transposase [Aerococcus sp. HMSC062A02]
MAKYDDWITEEGLIKIEGWARDGLTDKQIAYNCDVSERTFSTWKKRFSSISSALKKGKEVVDRQVESALLKSAVGYTTTERTITTNPDGTQTVKVTEKEVPPNTTAQIFWLKNRKPEEWRDRKETQISGGVEVENKNPYAELSIEELKQLAKDD